jgi:hypothetical protein
MMLLHFLIVLVEGVRVLQADKDQIVEGTSGIRMDIWTTSLTVSMLRAIPTCWQRV